MLPTSAEVIARRRLHAMLREGVHGPLTLVTAPAGYGKSVLVRSWAAQEGDPYAIVNTTLDDDGAAPLDFWASLFEGLQGAGVDVSEVFDPGAPVAADGVMLARLARAVAAHSTPVVWVLDCGEYALPPLIADGLRRLIDRSTAGLRVILLTRTDPLLPLHRYALIGALTEIRAADLSFTATETARLMQRAGLDLSPADVDALRVRTRGWPAGLRFAAMSLAGRTDTKEAIREFRGDTQNVAGYLMTEVLAKQPPAMREFLLRTCLLDELEPGSVGALTGQPSDPRVLEFLSHGNAFVEPVPGRHSHYRYQPLFREFLRSQLAFENAALTAALHREASQWLAKNGQPLPAIRHAALAQEWPMAARHFVEGLCYAGLLTGRQRRLQEKLLGSIPAVVEGVEAALTRAAFALAELDARRAASELDAARILLDGNPGVATRACSTALAVLEASAASLGPDPRAALDAAVVAEHAVQLMPAHDEVAHAELVAVAAGCKGRALLQVGDLPAAAAALEEGVNAAQDPHLVGVLSELMSLATLAEAMSGHLQRASGLASRLLPPGEGDGIDAVPAPRAASLALAWVRLDEYDLSAAETVLSLGTGRVESLDASVLLRVEALLHARLWAAREEYDLARAELRAVSLLNDKRPVNSWLDHLLVVGQAALLLAQGAPEDAVGLIQGTGGCEHVECGQLLHQALLDSGRSAAAVPQPSSALLARQPLAVRVNALLLQAEQSIHEGDRAFGEICLQTALQVAAPEHLRRPFLEAPESVQSLLAHSGLTDHHRWLQVAATEVGRGQDTAASVADGQRQVRGHGGLPGTAPIVNPLTKKEQEVLGYLAELLTTDEIATTMFVSVNTVRSHVRSVLRKLGVARRNEAVRRAWELKLLPPRDAA